MKRHAKSLLRAAGLIGPAEKLYFNAQTASLPVLRRELTWRRNPPDSYPLPPGRLIFKVIGCHWRAVYYESGARIIKDMEETLRGNSLSLRQFEAILDFGCGCGRLIRHVRQRTGAKLYGTDINPLLIEWCREYLPFGRFSVNELRPPLSYDDDTFDFMYARSVFTHLPEALQHAWIGELQRLLRPGGYLYLTMHGPPLSEGLSQEQRKRLEAGELVVIYGSVAGENLCSTFAAQSYVEEQLLGGFELVEFVEGRDQEHLRQDIYLLQAAGE